MCNKRLQIALHLSVQSLHFTHAMVAVLITNLGCLDIITEWTPLFVCTSRHYIGSCYDLLQRVAGLAEFGKTAARCHENDLDRFDDSPWLITLPFRFHFIKFTESLNIHSFISGAFRR